MKRRSRTRGYQIGFIALLLVCAAQVTYWVIDEYWHTTEVTEDQVESYERDRVAAGQLLANGTPWTKVIELFPHLELTEGGVRVSQLSLDALDQTRRRRLNRYVWEGGFFLVVLAAGMVVLSRTLLQQYRLRLNQENFLAAVSHELKSPLAAIRLCGETLQLRDPEKARRDRMIERMLQDVDRLQDMIQNILGARQLDEGVAASRAEELMLDKLVAEVADEFSPNFAGNGVELRTQMDEGCRIMADVAAVRSVTRNLLDNAVKAVATNRGDKRVEVQVQNRGGRIALAVRDNGCGFEPKESQRLFDKFYRRGHEMRRTSEGVGLGLYLVERWADLDNGKVTARSDGVDQGALFEVTWPAMN